MASRNNGKHRQRHHIRDKAPRTITLPPLPKAVEATAPVVETVAAETEQPVAETAVSE